MKNLFFVAVASGIFSGTTLTVQAQPSVNMERMDAAVPVKKSPKFIEHIELKPVTAIVEPLKTTDPTAKTNINKFEDKNAVSVIEKCSSIQFKYALLLDMDVEAVTNYVLIEEIEKWMDTRYRYGGTTEKGIDCSAYTGTLLSDVYGLEVPRTSRAQYIESEKIGKEDLQQGDLVFFNTARRGRGVSHVGLYLGNGYFTHSGSSTGVTISNLDESYWSSKFLKGGRIAATSTASSE